MKNFLLFLVMTILIGVNFISAQTWSTYGEGLDYPVNSVCYFNNTLYAAGGSIYAWNGSAWVEKSDGMILLMDVYSLAVYNNALYAGGFFTVLTPENNWYNNTARFNNGSWTTCGSGMGNDGMGMSDYVNYLHVHNGQLFAGGRFGSAGGDPLNPQETPYIARFDGTQWNPVGAGMDFTVTDLTTHNGELIASGFFTYAGGVSANYIAKWNGTTWSPIGTGTDGKVTALASFNGELYAGGLFDNAGGSPAKSIAKWNGQSWSPVGAGILGGGQVYTLAVYNNKLYAGGTFTTVSGNAGNYFMSWNGNQWESVGAGTDGPVIFIYPNGSDLIIGGNFSTAGGITANKIAVYKNITDVGQDENIPGDFELSQNYPNPFNPSTKIRYCIPELNYVSIKVFDVLGNEISILADGEKPAGTYEIEFKADNLPDGIYFYKIQAGKFTETRKMVLLK